MAKKQDTPKPDETQKKLEELENNWKRALADYQNLKKRTESEKQDFIKFTNTVLLLKLLPVLDNIEKAAVHLKDEGLNMVIRQFKQVLKEEGITEIEVLGKNFNPDEMEAIESVKGEEDNKVIEVILPGYSLNGKIIRPAKVKVAKKDL